MRLLLFAVCVVGLIFSAAAEEKAFTKAAIQGQWKTVADDRLFFGEIGADGLGKYTLIQPGNIILTNGKKAGRAVAHHQYKIVRVIPEKRTIVVLLKFARGSGEREATFVFAKDGKTATNTTTIVKLETTTKLTYVDGKTEP